MNGANLLVFIRLFMGEDPTFNGTMGRFLGGNRCKGTFVLRLSKRLSSNCQNFLGQPDLHR